MLACIRYLAQCPCPRCYVKKADMRLMGTVRDMHRRQSQRREDTEPIQYDVNKTRSWIFEDGLGPNSTLINKVLTSRSLQPQRVSLSSYKRVPQLGLRLVAVCLLPLFCESPGASAVRPSSSIPARRHARNRSGCVEKGPHSYPSDSATPQESGAVQQKVRHETCE